MRYEDFKTSLVNEIKKELGDTFRVITFTASFGGEKLDALCIAEDGCPTSPAFYFKDYAIEYDSGADINNLAREIIGAFFAHSNMLNFTNEKIISFENFKDQIIYRVVNKRAYSNLLEIVPHVEFHDLAIIFCCFSPNETELPSMITITNDLLKLWKTDTDAVYKLAQINTVRLLPLNVFPFFDGELEVISLCKNYHRIIKALPSTFMYIFTNTYCLNGFSVIFYPDLLQDFADRFGSFYILPSSEDEAIFIPKDAGFTIPDLKSLVRGINNDITLEDKFLSNSIYFYDTETGKLDAYLTPAIFN